MISFIVHMTRNIPNDLSKTLHSSVKVVWGAVGICKEDAAALVTVAAC